MDKRVLRTLCLIGACWVAKEIVAKALYGLTTNLLLPRRNLRERYDAGDWAIVTGATDGIGEQLCYELALSKFNIVLIARNDEKLSEVAATIRELGVQTKCIKFDFSQLSTVQQAKDYQKFLLSELQDIDVGILCNVVGIARNGIFH